MDGFSRGALGRLPSCLSPYQKELRVRYARTSTQSKRVRRSGIHAVAVIHQLLGKLLCGFVFYVCARIDQPGRGMDREGEARARIKWTTDRGNAWQWKWLYSSIYNNI